MVLCEAIRTQRAIRRLKSDPIPDAVIRQILDAAICAPSGGNRQGWAGTPPRPRPRVPPARRSRRRGIWPSTSTKPPC
ncbi:MAG: nitroreductase family protein [Candidatus Rokubacteria bacterium]|nr:nitroreductase family protein [Candidatus Rokubacteria bacterium]